MAIVGKAIRAVTVEFCGVFLFVWLLVNFGALGLKAVDVVFETPAHAMPPVSERDEEIKSGSHRVPLGSQRLAFAYHR